MLEDSAIANRFEALRGLALSPLVGRDQEIDVVLRRWASAKAGDGQVVLVSGEPGLGKSRLTAAFQERLCAEPHTRLRYQCSPYHRDSVLHPFVVQLGRAARLALDDPAQTQLKKSKPYWRRRASPRRHRSSLPCCRSRRAAAIRRSH